VSIQTFGPFKIESWDGARPGVRAAQIAARGGEVWVSIDPERLARAFGRRALQNMSGRAVEAGGLVIISDGRHAITGKRRRSA